MLLFSLCVKILITTGVGPIMFMEVCAVVSIQLQVAVVLKFPAVVILIYSDFMDHGCQLWAQRVPVDHTA